jgi:hypothetical protein
MKSTLGQFSKTILNLATIFAFFFSALIPTAQASIPTTMSYQGILKDASNNYLTGTYSMTFKLYSASSGGSALWTETQSSVSVTSGRFAVTLGSTTAISLSFNADYWLGITVGADSEMTPRVKLTSVGYAYTAETVVNGFTQTQHDALTHKNIEGVRDNTVMIGKTNFKLDAYSTAAANSLGDLVVDTFSDATGINSGSSSGYSWRGTPNYDVTLSAGGIDSNVVLMLHTNGSDASTTFTDSANTPKTVTANGNAQIDTAQSKFSGAAGLFDGSGDTLTLADSADWDFGTGDFTIDFWVRFNSASAGQHFINRNNNEFQIRYAANGKLAFMIEGAEPVNVTWSPSANVWYHIAAVRSGSTAYVFVDGTSIGSGSNSSDVQGTTGIEIGTAGGAQEFNGWMDELRVSKGTARWTSNFTPPSQEYTTTASTATVISNAYSEPVAPTEAMVMADETLGSGSITYSVSRDNGTTWTACTKETVTNISSQPSGTQLKWKAVITGDAELNAIAVAV